MTTLPLPAGLLLLTVTACFLPVARAQCLPDQLDVGGMTIEFATTTATYDDDVRISAMGTDAPTVTATGVENDEIVIEKTIVAYEAPSPPPRSGPHRYQFILYTLDLLVPLDQVPGSRSGFNLARFITGLGLGNSDPVASFQFTAEN
ncbi:uncharacterized protein [Littorina saxatilis]|uniref:uncharacterized protein isoform X2 n=1 Tax=Littorina saxatilis TaxID=31220 RepID=UPI0038B58972